MNGDFSLYFFGGIFFLTFVIHLMKHGFRSWIGLSLDEVLSNHFEKFNYFKKRYRSTKKKRFLFLHILDKVKDVGWIIFLLYFFGVI